MGNAAVALATRARLASSSALPSSLARAAHRRRRHRRSRRRPVPVVGVGVGVARVDVDIARRGMTREVTRVGSYALKQTLGKGAFGWVKLGVQDKTGVKVAVKVRAMGGLGDARARGGRWARSGAIGDGCRQSVMCPRVWASTTRGRGLDARET